MGTGRHREPCNCATEGHRDMGSTVLSGVWGQAGH